MAIGDLLHQTPVTTPDPYTGCPVTRLTPPDHTSHHMYFYNRMVTSDSSRLLYCAEINGRRNLYLMELATGDAVQLTEGDALDDYGAMISADDKSVYYQQDRKVWKLDLATLQRTCLYAAPDGWDCGNWGMSDDNRYLVMTETRRDTLPDLTGKKGWEFFPLTCAAKPLCHIVYLDTQTGEHHIVVEDRCWFGHAQLRPGDPDTILFCHEGPYDMIDARLWLIQSDGSRYRCARPQPKDVIITHEFWMPTGDRLAYVYRKADDGSTETIRMMRPETLEEELFMPCLPYAHFICDRQRRWFVGDCQGQETPIHLQTGEGRGQESATTSSIWWTLPARRRSRCATTAPAGRPSTAPRRTPTRIPASRRTAAGWCSPPTGKANPACILPKPRALRRKENDNHGMAQTEEYLHLFPRRTPQGPDNEL